MYCMSCVCLVCLVYVSDVLRILCMSSASLYARYVLCMSSVSF